MAADPGCGSAVVAEPGWGSAVVAEPGWGSAVSALAGMTPASEEDAPVCRRLRVAMSNALHIPTTFPLAFFVVLLLWVLVFFLTSSRKRVRPLWPGEAMMPSGSLWIFPFRSSASPPGDSTLWNEERRGG